jgi:DNA-binding PadR family transcriptional regulator
MQANSTLELALAGLLQQKPQSGYDLRKSFATTAMRHYSDSPGSIYPALRRMEMRGWITAGPETYADAEDTRRRRVFELTPHGAAALVAWMEQPVTRDDIVSRTPELMLRFAFMDGNVPRATALRFLEQFERELSLYVSELLKPSWEEMKSKFPVHTGVLAFQAGIQAMEAQLAWARQARTWLLEDSQP